MIENLSPDDWNELVQTILKGYVKEAGTLAESMASRAGAQERAFATQDPNAGDSDE